MYAVPIRPDESGTGNGDSSHKTASTSAGIQCRHPAGDCHALCIDRSTYAYYELGETQPSLLMLVRLAKLYDVTTDYLLGIQPEEKQPTPFERELLSLVRKYWGESSGS